MSEAPVSRVAILDLGMGNLFSVRQACTAVGLKATITADKAAVRAADAVILPGVGAFGDAMATLRRLDLTSLLKDIAASGAPLVGICLGMQLFMSESEEFGRHQGLGFFTGPVVRFEKPRGPAGELKVPQVGWNRIFRPQQNSAAPAPAPDSMWPLAGIAPGEFMYFVHSYYARPSDADAILTLTRYGDVEFCSSVLRRNLFACQFHPERSGPAGLAIYRNIARHIASHAATAGTT
jgi:glutamine amidotransferase